MYMGGNKHRHTAMIIRLVGVLLPLAILVIILVLMARGESVSTSFFVLAICWLIIGILEELFRGGARQLDTEPDTAANATNGLERDRTTTILNNLTDAIISTDIHGEIQLYNAAALNLLDTNDSLDGKQISDILPLKNRDGEAIVMSEEFAKTKSAVSRDDLEYTFSDGENMRLEIVYSPIRSSFSSTKLVENHEGYVLIMRDITKAKSLEEERDEFISVVSHELRTPVTIMEGSLSNLQLMLSRKGVTVTKTTLSSSINMAHTQVLYLAKMINDLSTLSRAERGVADSAEEIDVQELMHKLHESYHQEARQKKLHLNLDLGTQLGTVTASRLYLEELLQNFITNAIKYTTDGSVTMSAHTTGGRVTLSVKDSGIGISKLDQTKIFQKFYRSEDYRTRETNGTGLGLYVAVKLAKKLGTRIEFTSRLNHGSTFWIELPATIKK